MTGISEFNKIGTQLRPVIKLLMVHGGYPVAETPNFNKSRKPKSESSSFVEKPLNLENIITLFQATAGKKPVLAGEKGHKYEIVKELYQIATWKRAWAVTFYSYSFKALSMFSLVTFVCNTVFNVPFPIKLLSYAPSYAVYENSRSRIYYDLALGIISALKLTQHFLLFLNANIFVLWLNNWSEFEQSFLNCFKHTNYHFKMDIKKFRNTVLILYLGAPTIFWTFGGYYVVSSMFELYVPLLSISLISMALYILWGYPLVEDIKVFMIFKTNAAAAEQIRMGINGMSNEGKHYLVTPADVIGWRRLIQSTRQQALLAGKYMKSSEMTVLAETVVTCSLGCSFLMDIIGELGLSVMAIPVITFGTLYYNLISVLRLYFKVLLAEKIPEQELLIAEEILEMESTCTDAATKAELKFLYDMLTHSTVTVNLGNYFLMNKRLLLHMAVQIVTYLIVILQFRGSIDSKLGKQRP